MRHLILAGLSWFALACGDVPTDEASTDASGTSSDASSGEPAETTPASTSIDTSSTSGSGSTSTSAQSSTPESSDSTDAGADTTGSETGGSDDTGAPLPRGQWAITEITYSQGGMSETLSMQDRTFCDATLSPDQIGLRYQQAEGYTVWTLNIPTTASVGSLPLTQDFSGASMNINEVGDTWQAYFDPSMAFGTVELTDVDLQPGGVVAGTVTATLTAGNGTSADFTSTFYAEIP